MIGAERLVLVLGATGQQGGSVANALARDGWRVRALVRDPDSSGAQALTAAGIETVPGDLGDTASVRAAMAGAYGAFSVLPSSGQSAYGISDTDEVRFGIAVADAAREAGIAHFIYSSSSAAGPNTGVGHFDSKFEVETHVRALDIDSTIVRPSTVMELLLTPDFGVPDGRLTFFMRPDQSMQFIAVEDIGRVVAGIFAQREVHRGQSVELAGDRVTGNELADRISRAAGRPISYQRFPDGVLDANPMLKALTRLVDEGPLAGTADIEALRERHPGLLTFEAWLGGMRQSPLLQPSA